MDPEWSGSIWRSSPLRSPPSCSSQGLQIDRSLEPSARGYGWVATQHPKRPRFAWTPRQTADASHWFSPLVGLSVQRKSQLKRFSAGRWGESLYSSPHYPLLPHNCFVVLVGSLVYQFEMIITVVCCLLLLLLLLLTVNVSHQRAFCACVCVCVLPLCCFIVLNLLSAVLSGSINIHWKIRDY